MRKRREPVTFTEVHDVWIPTAAKRVFRRYARYGVTREDLQQEMYVYLYDKAAKVRRWLANDPQQLYRIWWDLVDTGRKYGEQEKAARVGYDPSDVQWYNAATVEMLLVYALDDTWDGRNHVEAGDGKVRGGKAISEGNDLLTMVCDIRKAIDKCQPWVREALYEGDPITGWRDDAIQAVVDYLGGNKPFTGRRQVLSNAAAQAVTE